MTDLSKKIFDTCQVRKTRRQKTAFIALLKEAIPALQVQQMAAPRSRNLVIGDPETASVILSAHYDTCARLPFPNFITPKRPLISIIYSFLILLPYFLVIFILNLLLRLMIQDFWLHYWFSLACYAGMMWLMLAGPANKHTANDNTSGVLTLLELYQSLDDTQRQKVCLVLFDNEEKGVIGSGQFRRKYKALLKDRLLINFDCVSDGDTFLIGISKKASEKYHAALSRAFISGDDKTVLLESLKKVYYPSDQAGFPMAVAVASLKHSRLWGYYMDRIHTNRDTVFDTRNIDFLVERTTAFIEDL